MPRCGYARAVLLALALLASPARAACPFPCNAFPDVRGDWQFHVIEGDGYTKLPYSPYAPQSGGYEGPHCDRYPLGSTYPATFPWGPAGWPVTN
jgi:hypothetical protein